MANEAIIFILEYKQVRLVYFQGEISQKGKKLNKQIEIIIKLLLNLMILH